MKEKIDLVHRLNRIQGQIEAIKKSIQSEEKEDCLKTVRLIKASNNALKKFCETYVNYHLDECINNNLNPKHMEKELKEIVTSVFSI